MAGRVEGSAQDWGGTFGDIRDSIQKAFYSRPLPRKANLEEAVALLEVVSSGDTGPLVHYRKETVIKDQTGTGWAAALIKVLSYIDRLTYEDETVTRLSCIAREGWGERVAGKQWAGTHSFGEPTAAASLEDGLFLYSLVRAVKPKIAVEVGTHGGLTAAFIGAALEDNGLGVLHTVEAMAVWAGTAREKMLELGLQGRVIVHEGFGEEVLRGLGEEVDFFFEDGDHRSKTIIAEVAAVSFAPGAYLAFHDSMLLDEVRLGIDWAEKALDCERVSIATCRGMDVLRRRNVL